MWPNQIYHVTNRTQQERYLLRPTARARELVLGVIGRALFLYKEVSLYAFVFLSNHYHLLASASDGASLSSFLCHVNANIGRELGRLHHWRGGLWNRRSTVTPILDDDELVRCLRYVLAQGVKEGLVLSPKDWPGASCVPGLLGQELVGTWFSRDQETRARRRGAKVREEQFATAYPIELAKLPCWAHLTADEYRARISTMIREIEGEAFASVPISELQSVDPHSRPDSPASSPAPLCHTSKPHLRARFRALYRDIRQAFADAAARWAQGFKDVLFPPNTFPPRMSFQPGPALDLSADPMITARTACPPA